MRRYRRQNTEHRIQNSNPPIPPFTKGGLGGITKSELLQPNFLRKLFTVHCSLFTNKKGVSLVELMITLTIFSIIISMIYSVYNTFLKTATAERKVAKTEMDVINVSWPLIKEIESAGFGVPSSGSCTPAINVAGNTLTIHSTAAGDSEYAGKWSYVVGTSCGVTSLPTASDETNAENRRVVVINNLDKSLLGYDTVGASVLSACASNPNYVNNLAYWVATTNIPPSSPNLGCYETTYRLYPGSAPAMCASDTTTLGRRVSTKAGEGTTQPMLDCVLDLAYRFGCISSSGNLTWQSGTNCGTSKLRLMKVGMIVQSSPRRDSQVPADITLFEDLSGQSKTVTLSEEQRYYKWRKIEQTISLRNLE